MALKIARIVDLCGKSSGLADFENTVDRGSVVIFDAVSGLCLSYVGILGPKFFDHRSFFSLGWYVNEFIQIIYFFERSSLKLRSETVIGIVLCYSIKHVAFFTIWEIVVFTCTSLPLNLYTSVFVRGCGFGSEQKFWRIDGFGEEKARIGGFAYPYSPPSFLLRDKLIMQGEKCGTST